MEKAELGKRNASSNLYRSELLWRQKLLRAQPAGLRCARAVFWPCSWFFDDLGHALAVPAVYLVVTFLEGNFVTPLVLGRRLTLNPVVIFVGLLFWFFLRRRHSACAR